MNYPGFTDQNGKWQQVVVYGDINTKTTTTYQQECVLFIAEDKVK